jgi:hypothetical protein
MQQKPTFLGQNKPLLCCMVITETADEAGGAGDDDISTLELLPVYAPVSCERIHVFGAELAAQPHRRAHVVKALVAGLGQRAEPLAQKGGDLGAFERTGVHDGLARGEAAELV